MTERLPAMFNSSLGMSVVSYCLFIIMVEISACDLSSQSPEHLWFVLISSDLSFLNDRMSLCFTKNVVTYFSVQQVPVYSSGIYLIHHSVESKI